MNAFSPDAVDLSWEKRAARAVKEKGGFSTRERGTSVNYYPSRVGRTAKTRFIPGRPGTRRIDVTSSPPSRSDYEANGVPSRNHPRQPRPRFNRIVIKLPSIRTNARAWFGMKKLACLLKKIGNAIRHLSSLPRESFNCPLPPPPAPLPKYSRGRV